MTENNEVNRKVLARLIVSEWDIEELMRYSQMWLAETYRKDDEEFQYDWDRVYLNKID